MDAHEREAAGAAAGMREVYGEPHARPSLDDCYGRTIYVGEWMTWRREEWPAGRTASGSIRQIAGRVYLVDHDGDLVAVTPAEVMPL